MNRFSKDIYSIDETYFIFALFFIFIFIFIFIYFYFYFIFIFIFIFIFSLPQLYMFFFNTLFNMAGIMVVISMVTPLFLVFLFPLGLIYKSVQKYYISSSRELKRVKKYFCSRIYFFLFFYFIFYIILFYLLFYFIYYLLFYLLIFIFYYYFIILFYYFYYSCSEISILRLIQFQNLQSTTISKKRWKELV